MNKMIVIWNKAAPHSYKRVIFRFNENRAWTYINNWKFNVSLPHFNIITPFLRLQKCNGSVYIGLGNHYLELGW